MRQLALPYDAMDAPEASRSAFWRADFILVAITVFLSPMNYLRADFAYITLGDCFALLTLGVMLVQGRLPLTPLVARPPAGLSAC